MPSYVGEIQISSKNGFFVNFYPGYRYQDGKFTYLTDSDIRELLPESQYYNINLVSTSPSLRLEDRFQDGDDVILDFSFSDLTENMKGDGGRYPTAWKLDVSRLYGQSIRHMDDLGYYCVLDRKDVLGSWKESSTVDLYSPNINEGMMVMLPGDTPDTLVGPYRVRYDEDRETFYIRTSLEQRVSLITGYTYTGGFTRYAFDLVMEDVTRRYIPIEGEGISLYALDQISDEDLLENFRQSLSKKLTRQFHLDAPNIEHMLDVYQKSLLSSRNASEEIAAQRIRRLKAMFSSELRFSSTLDSVAALAPELVRLYADDPAFKNLMSRLAGNSDFVSQLGQYEDFQNIKSRMQTEIDGLQSQKDRLNEALLELETINPEKQLEMYREHLEQLEKMKEKARAELDDANRKVHLGTTILEMENRSNWLDEEITRKNKRIEQLDEQMNGLEKKLDDILEESSRRSFEISFDNMISERFLEHTARLENTRRTELYQHAVKAIRNMPRTHLSDEQLVETLVHAMKLRRPEYSRNEILNILICMFGGFLTILSGPPGSGKTSICRIAAEVLALDEPAKLEAVNPDFPSCSRYVPVSVERGWTSRRDLIGFYNSLTRQFDKADARLFDLLALLDQESRMPGSQNDLPALVLLDDANLSSMEYYWADFMTMEEDADVRGTLALGENYTMQVPRSLHFAASIQSDHTTEPLTARLLDRAWVISLPEKKLSLSGASLFDQEPFEPLMVSEAQIDSVFSPAQSGADLPGRLEECFLSIRSLFEEAGLPLSIRSEGAIRCYVLTAMRWFEADSEDPAYDEGFIALDYAILQRMLPRLAGSSERFRSILEKMLRLLEESGLRQSAAKLKEIMERGDDSMQFYQFFS